ncbi:hypothetical protein, partial [Roseateles albus]|nr:hypothetical protein [Roseateles albus]
MKKEMFSDEFQVADFGHPKELPISMGINLRENYAFEISVNEDIQSKLLTPLAIKDLLAVDVQGSIKRIDLNNGGDFIGFSNNPQSFWNFEGARVGGEPVAATENLAQEETPQEQANVAQKSNSILTTQEAPINSGLTNYGAGEKNIGDIFLQKGYYTTFAQLSKAVYSLDDNEDFHMGQTGVPPIPAGEVRHGSGENYIKPYALLEYKNATEGKSIRIDGHEIGVVADWKVLDAVILGTGSTGSFSTLEVENTWKEVFGLAVFAAMGAGLGVVGAVGAALALKADKVVDKEWFIESNGIYHCANSAALATRCGDAVVISFRGTNDNDEAGILSKVVDPTEDELDWIYMSEHYAELKPFVDMIDAYVARENISKVFVTGHSLGGGMALAYMDKHPDKAGVSYEAVTFAAPGYLLAGSLDERVICIEMDGDPVPDLKYHQGYVVSVDAPLTHTMGNDNGKDYGDVDYHSMDIYLAAAKALDSELQNTSYSDSTSIHGFASDMFSKIDYGLEVSLAGKETASTEDYSYASRDPAPTFDFMGDSDILPDTGNVGFTDYFLGGPKNDKLGSLLLPSIRNVLIGGAGDDTYLVDNSSDSIIESESGDVDTVIASAFYALPANVENLTLNSNFAWFDANIDGTGNALANVIVGNDGNNILAGLDGDDTLISGLGRDSLVGGAGDDDIFAESGGDILQGGIGNDEYLVKRVSDEKYDIYEAGSGDGNIDTLYFQETPSLIDFDGIDDLNFALVDNDLWIDLDVVGTFGTFDDNEGTVVIHNQRSDSSVVESLVITPEEPPEGFIGTKISLVSVFNALNNLGGSGFHRLVLSGTFDPYGLQVIGDNYIYGTAGNNNLIGKPGASDDVFVLSKGIDTIDGGAGNDKLIGDLSLTGPYVNGISYEINGSALNSGSSFAALVAAFDSPITTYVLNLASAGRTTATNIESYQVDLTGSSANDLLVYQNGTRYDGGLGTDTFYADWGSNTLGVTWTNQPGQAQNVNGVFIAGVERLLLTTGSGADYISNSSAATNDFIQTGGGDDQVYAGGGDDEVYGWANNDVLVGGAGADRVYGGSGDDRLFDDSDSNADDDYLYGDDGNDILTSKGGNDQMSGGAGNDTYSFESTGSYVAIVNEQGNGNDLLRLMAPSADFAKTRFVAHGDDLAIHTYTSAGTLVRSALVIDMAHAAGQLETLEVDLGTSANAATGRYNVLTAWTAAKAGDATGGAAYIGSFVGGIYTGDGPDFITGTDGNDTINGFGGNDKIFGLTGSDKIYGDEGDDTISLTVDGVDYVSGGAGTDSLSADLAGFNAYGYGRIWWEGTDANGKAVAAVDVNSSYELIDGYLQTATTNQLQVHWAWYSLSNAKAATLTFTGIENLSISASSAVADDDLIFARGTGVYDGKAGNDAVYADLSAATNDINFVAGSRLNYAGQGSSFSNFERVLIKTGSGQDSIDSSSASLNDYLELGSGNDTAATGGGSDTVKAGAGDDTISMVIDGVDIVSGGAGTDNLSADLGNFNAYGYGRIWWEGTDANGKAVAAVDVNSSYELIDGYVQTATTNQLQVHWAWYSLSNAKAATLTFTGIENLSISASSAVADDDLIFARGTGVYDGKAGNDAIYADLSAATNGINFVAGSGVNYAGQGSSFSNFERLLLRTGSGNDNVDSASLSLADYVELGAGDDTAKTGAGSDTVNGGAGDDTMSLIVDGVDNVSGGAGSDRLSADLSNFNQYGAGRIWWEGTDASGKAVAGVDVNSTFELIDNYVSTATTNQLQVHWAYYGLSNARAATLQFTGIENLSIIASSAVADDDLILARGTGVYDGKAGSDAIYADLSAASSDISFVAGSGVNYAGQGSSFSNFERLLLRTGSGNDSIDSAALSMADYVELGAGDDTAKTGAGSDTVNGGAGDDTISLTVDGVDNVSGGAGTDRLSADLTNFNAYGYGRIWWEGSDASGNAVAGVDVNSTFELIDTYVQTAATNLLQVHAVYYNLGNTRLATLKFTGIENLSISASSAVADDDLILARGNGVYDGKAGSDAIYADLSAATNGINFVAGSGVNYEGQGSSFSNFERLLLRTGSGNDSIDSAALSMADYVELGAGDDTAKTGAGSDTVNGGAGDDTISLTVDGVDNVSGGAGTDRLSADLTNFNAYGYGRIWWEGSDASGNAVAGVDVNSTFELIDTYVQTAATNLLQVHAVYYNLGNTRLATLKFTGIENLSISASSAVADDDLILARGNGVYDGKAGSDAIYADLSAATNGINFVAGSGVNYEGQGSSFSNFERLLLRTGSGNDSIDSAALSMADYVELGAGDDTANTGAGSDTVNGGAGDDTISLIVDGVDNVSGGAGTDRLNADLTNFNVYGYGRIWWEGTDVNGKAVTGVDVNSTFELIDTYVQTAATNLLQVHAVYYHMGNARAATLKFTGIENLSVSASSAAADNDLIFARGTGVYDGKGGSDTFFANWSEASQSITWVNAAGAAQVVNGVTVSNFERLLVQTGSGDDLIDNSAAAVGATNDYIATGAGNDTLNGGAGNDQMLGGTGDDTYYVDSLADVVTEQANAGNDTIITSLNYSLGNNIENVIITGAAGVVVTGNGESNQLQGGAGNDTLNGGAGNDLLNGGAGNDSLFGGTGDDIYVVDAAGDTVTELTGQGSADTVQSTITFTLGANLENLTLLDAAPAATAKIMLARNAAETLASAAPINGTGNTLANIIIGNSGANTLS